MNSDITSLRFGFLIYSMLCILTFLAQAFGDNDTPLTLAQIVQMAIEVSPDLKIKQAQTNQSHAEQAAARSRFMPTFETSYTFNRESHPSYIGKTLTDPNRDYTWAITLNQPLYRPQLTQNLTLADLSLEQAKLAYDLQTRTVTFNMLTAYYNLLKNRKQFEVAQKQVDQITAHEEKARAFYAAGKIPLNELLQAGVRLANARQTATVAENHMALAEVSVNLLLRRPLELHVEVIEEMSLTPWVSCLNDCLSIAAPQRLELKMAEVELGMAETRLGLARYAYHPTVNLNGFYYKKGTQADLFDKQGITYPEGWEINASLEWTIWSGNRRSHHITASQAGVSQSRTKRDALMDSISYEVRQSYLNLMEANRNLAVMAEALGQAEENLRLNQGRFDHDLATTTDVLDAQALLTITHGRHVNALYDHQIAIATLKQAMGLDILDALTGQTPSSTPPQGDGK